METGKGLSDYPVLIAEDDPNNRLLLRQVCRSLNLVTEEAENGLKALELARSNRYSLYIIDIMMPRMDGITLIGHIRELVPDAIILVQTAIDDSETIIRTMRHGVFDYVMKPIDINQLSRTLEKALYFHHLAEFRKRHKAYLRNEIAEIREIQASLLPDLDRFSNFDITASMLPASELSGDFFDAYPIKKNVHQLILCDVAGHGIASSYLGSELKSIYKLITERNVLLDATLHEINNYVYEKFGNSVHFSTAALCQLDTRSGVVSYASAGHPPALFWSHEQKILQELGSTGPLIGQYPELSYGVVKLTMEPGDTLLLYTDGVTDILDEEDSNRFGHNRLRKAFQEAAGAGSRSVVFQLLDELYRFNGYRPQPDDISFICVRRK